MLKPERILLLFSATLICFLFERCQVKLRQARHLCQGAQVTLAVVVLKVKELDEVL